MYHNMNSTIFTPKLFAPGLFIIDFGRTPYAVYFWARMRIISFNSLNDSL